MEKSDLTEPLMNGSGSIDSSLLLSEQLIVENDEEIVTPTHHHDEDVVSSSLLLSLNDDENQIRDENYYYRSLERQDDGKKNFYFCVTHRFAENLAFLFGSTFYLWIDIWTLRDEIEQSVSGGDASTTNDDYVIFADWDLWDVLNLLAPFCFVINAVLVLFHLATISRHEVLEASNGRGVSSLQWEILVVTSFGCAALIEFFNYLLVDEQMQLYFTLSSVAMHLYLLEAILALSRRGRRNRGSRWYVWGDVLFFVGSLLDVVLSYFERADTTITSWDHLQYGSVVSSILWFLDPVLYMLGDWNNGRRTTRQPQTRINGDREEVVRV